MYRKLLIATILISSLGFSITAKAQEASTSSQANLAGKTQEISAEKQALIKELLEVIDQKKMSQTILDSMFDNAGKAMPALVWQGLSGMKEMQELPLEQQQQLRTQINEKLAGITKRFRELFAQRIDYARMSEELTSELYAKYFTENELRDLISFYNSPTGKRTLELMPSLFADAMERTSERVLPLVGDLMNEISREEATRFEKEVSRMAEYNHKTTKPRVKLSKPRGH